MGYAEHIKKRQVFERVEVIGPIDQGRAVLEELYEAGFRTIRSGVYTDKEMFPRCDDKRFLFIAEREVDPNPWTAHTSLT